jgi:hypothetical protein
LQVRLAALRAEGVHRGQAVGLQHKHLGRRDHIEEVGSSFRRAAAGHGAGGRQDAAAVGPGHADSISAADAFPIAEPGYVALAIERGDAHGAVGALVLTGRPFAEHQFVALLQAGVLPRGPAHCERSACLNRRVIAAEAARGLNHL